MRDIRSDLRERLAHLTDEFNAAQEAYLRERDERDLAFSNLRQDFARRIDAIQLLLEMEQSRPEAMSSDQPPKLREPLKPILPFAEFVLTKLYAEGPLSKDDIRRMANEAGYFNEGAAAVGRVIHLTLRNLISAGKVIRHDVDRFMLVTKNRNSTQDRQITSTGNQRALN